MSSHAVSILVVGQFVWLARLSKQFAILLLLFNSFYMASSH